MNFQINQQLCIKCKHCIEVCPVNLIETNQKNEVQFIAKRTTICIGCGQCMAVCSTQAITANDLSYDDDFIDLQKQEIDYDNFMSFLASRRSVRNFKKKPLSVELINKILDSLAFAPFGASPEKMEITVINNRQTIETALPLIENFLDNIIKWVDNPLISLVIKKKKGAETFNTIKNHLYPIAKFDNYKLKYGDRITRGAPAIFIFHAPKDAEEHTNNALIYATYVMLAAHSLGLGASMIGIVPAAINKVVKVRTVFKIPPNHDAVMSVIVGYPTIKYLRTIKRKVNYKLEL